MNERNLMEFPESKIEKEKGENVFLAIRFLRHADKEGWGGDITKEGFEKSWKVGEELELPEGQDELKIFISQHCRPEETAMAIGEGGNLKYKIIDKKELGIYTDEVANYNEKNKLIFSKDFIGKIKDYVKEEKLSGGNKEGHVVQYVVDAGKPDDESLSSKELGGRIKDLLEDLILSTKKAKSDSAERILAISHSMILEHFVVHLLMHLDPEEFPSEKDIIEKIGGGVEFLEGFDYEIHRKNENEVKMKLKFRGKEYHIMENDLENAFV